MKKLRELFSDTVAYGISTVVSRFINYLLVPLYTNVFPTGEYGIYSVAFAAIAFLNVIFTFGMESSYLRYAKDRDRARDLFKTLQLFLLGTSTLFVLIIVLFSPAIMPLVELDGRSSIFMMMLGIIVLDTLSIVPFAEMRLSRRSYLFAAIKIGNVLINISLNLYLILSLKFGIEAIFISNLAASGITLIVVNIVNSDLFKGSWDTELMKKAWSFGIPFVPAGIGFVINEMLDRFFLLKMDPDNIFDIYGLAYTGEEIAGIYSACYKLAVFMLLLVQMFRMSWQPFFMRHSDDEEAPKIFAQTFNLYNVVAAAFFLTVALFSQQIVQIKVPFTDATLIGQDYWMGLGIVPLLLMAYWFQGWYINFSAGIFIKERTSRLPVITLSGAVITIGGNIMLVPVLGMMGSAAATLISYAFMAMLIYYYSSRAFEAPYEIIKGIAVMMIAASAVIIKPFLLKYWETDTGISGLLLFTAMLLILLINFRSIKSFRTA
ncbi:lipopolysaccharide biosynthesis protein [Balneola sp. MJW-20]|uniref:lipopolysaccharide biosynthesis protein n=1 Tax=Gracilimonas aurantiaca TaxID=3234185 RepID=UPI0034663A78